MTTLDIDAAADAGSDIGHGRKAETRAGEAPGYGALRYVAALGAIGALAGSALWLERPAAPPPATAPVRTGVRGAAGPGVAGVAPQGLPGIATIAGPAQKRVTSLPAGPLYWRVETFPTAAEARAAEGPEAVAIEAEGQGWLFSLVTKDAETAGAPRGTRLTEFGPVPVPDAPEYLLQIAEQTRAQGNVGATHTHPGVESWYIVAGEQALKLPTGILRAGPGQGLVGPEANVPLQILNAGAGERRAFNLFVLDASLPAPRDARSPAEVDAAFKRAFSAGDLDSTLALFADETVEISPFGVFPGKPAIRASVDTFMRLNPGLSVTFGESEVTRNTVVHRAEVTSELIRASGVSRFVLIHTLVVNQGQIVSIAQQLDYSDPETARYALALSPEGR
ncbi:MAG TPA: nuclear transport factor 2 family protein [Chloroflexota bacterium]|nr:nuclear transport factor 2 family protein [Chloroflexota bacterium]